MSIRVMARVWQHSLQRAGTLLVLLAIADYADDSGAAWPSVASLGRKARLTDRGVRKVLRNLVTSGELALEPRAGPAHCNVYRVLVTDPEHTSPRTAFTLNDTTVDPEQNSTDPEQRDIDPEQNSRETLNPGSANPSLGTVNKNHQENRVENRYARTHAREEIHIMNDSTNVYPDTVACLGCDEIIDTENFKTAHADACEFFRNTPAQLVVRHAAGPIELPVQEAV